MFKNLSPGAIGITNVTLDETIELALRHGFAGIDAPLDEIAQLSDPQEAGRKVSGAGLVWGSFGLPVDFSGDEQVWRDGLDRLPGLADIARQIGCTRTSTVIIPASDELDYDANRAFHAERLRPVADVLHDHGIGFGIEFIGPGTLRAGRRFDFVHDVDGILALCDVIGTPNMGVLLDGWHWYTARATALDITQRMAGKVVVVHVSDAPADRDIDEQIDTDRALPCATGVIDAKTFMRCLAQINYDGPVSAEPFMSFDGMDAGEVAAAVSLSMDKIMAMAQ